MLWLTFRAIRIAFVSDFAATGVVMVGIRGIKQLIMLSKIQAGEIYSRRMLAQRCRGRGETCGPDKAQQVMQQKHPARAVDLATPIAHLRGVIVILMGT